VEPRMGDAERATRQADWTRAVERSLGWAKP
jgi:hypothetical protein